MAFMRGLSKQIQQAVRPVGSAVSRALSTPAASAAPAAPAATPAPASSGGRGIMGAIRRAVQRRPFAEGGKVSSASKRADGCAQRGKTKGKII